MGHGHHNHHGHHHHGHHHNEEQSYGGYAGSSYAPPPQLAYGQQPLGLGGYGTAPPAPYGGVQPYGGYGSAQPYGGAVQPYQQQQNQIQHLNDLRADEQRHKHNEHRAEAVALGAAAFAAYEHHQVKADPAHAQRHLIEERLAEATAVGAAGYALYEHQQSRHDHNLIRQEEGHHHHRGHKHDKHHRHHLF
jgi:hypothetical protein